jgi:hypothetical protein
MRTLSQDELDAVSGGCRQRRNHCGGGWGFWSRLGCQPKPVCNPKPDCTPDEVPNPGDESNVP